ncbi:MAG TPA: flippase [Patescibacteria group bacterium]|nr:flippase [Patescibacteria group bacterium]
MANYTRRVALNTIIQVIGKAITTVISVVMLAYLARYLGVNGYGDYTTVFAFLGFFSIIADMGFFTVAVREMAKNPDDSEKIMGNIFTLRIFFAIIFLVVASVVGYLVPAYSASVKLSIFIGSFFSLFVLCNQLFVSIFQVKLRMDKMVISDVIGRITLFIMVMVSINMKLSLEYFILANVIANLVMFLASYIMSKRFFSFKLKFDKKYCAHILKEAIPLGIIIVLGLIYFKIDTIMLSIMKDSNAVGIYGAPYKILEILITIPAMFMGSVFPLAAKYLKDGDSRFVNSFHTSFDFMSIMVFPILVGILFIARPLVILVLGVEFTASITVLQILIFAVFIIFFSNIFNYFILASSLQKKLVWVYITSVLINICGNLLLIPYYSYIGSSFLTVFTELFVCISAYIIVYKNLKLVPRFNVFLKSFFASLVMGGALYLCKSLNLFIVIVFGAFIYLIVLYAIGGVKKEMVFKLLGR